MLYTLLCTVYSIDCIVYYTLYTVVIYYVHCSQAQSIYYTIYTVPIPKLYIVHRTIDSIHIVLCTVYSVHCTETKSKLTTDHCTTNKQHRENAQSEKQNKDLELILTTHLLAAESTIMLKRQYFYYYS